ncbi:hyaluronidase-like [Palaemon carinicauda]|uniref:hyaluronidase-like n=1 Tax=Palaemon carinicauda TaxID=392227 RepID=UPI0035B6289B
MNMSWFLGTLAIVSTVVCNDINAASLSFVSCSLRKRTSDSFGSALPNRRSAISASSFPTEKNPTPPTSYRPIGCLEGRLRLQNLLDSVQLVSPTEAGDDCISQCFRKKVTPHLLIWKKIAQRHRAPFHIRGKCIRLALLILTYIDNSHCFDVYWNIPSETCQKFGIYINASQYGIVQNTDDVFYGDKVSIFYGPGKFPWIENDLPVNGGIPQNASLIDHLEMFTDEVTKKLPKDFKGVAVLDFERYFPSYDMSAVEYKESSIAWVKAMHPGWTPSQIETEAINTFNETSREFFEILLWKGREMHPEALWGYYHYPYCQNDGPQEYRCQPQVVVHNDEMSWLMEASTTRRLATMQEATRPSHPTVLPPRHKSNCRPFLNTTPLPGS